jgi:hypothetical protein
MAGMEVLGRNCNVIPVASGQPFKMREASSALVVVTGVSTTSVSITERSSFGGGDTNLACIKNLYYSTAVNGTAAWGKITYVPGVTIAGLYLTGLPAQTFLFSALNTYTSLTITQVAFTLFTTELSDPFNYLNVTMGGSGGVTCSVILSDLVHQRGPANLPILAA